MQSVKIRNRGSAKLLSVAGDSLLDGAEIIQTSENNTFSHEWTIVDCTDHLIYLTLAKTLSLKTMDK